jgi:hypothetical protein
MLLSSAFIQKPQKVRSAEPRLTKWQSAAVVLAVGGVLTLWLFWTATWPIPRGRDNRNHAAPYLKAAFPDRPLTADFAESNTAPVAAVFHVIRRGRPDKAAKAIAFAGEQEFGFASPYVIDRLESRDPRLRTVSRRFLQKMSGVDLGPRASDWKSWWRNPPRSILGIVTVRYNSFHFAIPVTALVVGAVVLTINRRRQADFAERLGALLLLVGWFLLILTLGLHLVGGFETCTWGETQIAYYSDHGIVLGLEDARTGGFGLWLLLVAAWLVGPFAAVLLWECLPDSSAKDACKSGRG